MAFFIIIFDQFLSRSQLKIGTFSITLGILPPLIKWPFFWNNYTKITRSKNAFFRMGYLVSPYAKELTLLF